jgi:hydrogenase maturation protease
MSSLSERGRVNATVVIGLGNPLMRDEGVGLFVVRDLETRKERFPGVDFIEAGASALGSLHSMAGRRKAIFVDCAFMGERLGAIRRFSPDEARSIKRLAGFSLHEGDLLKSIQLSRNLGECPGEIVIFGIEPAVVEMGEGLSPLLADRLPAYVAAVEAELERHTAN